MRWWIGLLLLGLCSRGWAASSSLIFIRPEAAGPAVDIHNYVHGEWVLWPSEEGDGRLLSILSGVDWRLELGTFTRTTNRCWNYRRANDLESAGYFRARRSFLAGTSVSLLAARDERIRTEALVTSVNGDQVCSIEFQGPLPAGSLIVYGAQGWDDAMQLVRRAGGHAIVIEYPPRSGESWSRLWRFPDSWSSDLPVSPAMKISGLIPAREVAGLLLRPGSFGWVENDSGAWGGANRWLEYVRNTGVGLILSLLAYAMYIAGCAVYCIANEQKGKLAAGLLYPLFIVPAALDLGGEVCRRVGLLNWPVVFALCLAALWVGSAALGVLLRKAMPGVHALLSVCVVGAGVLLTIDPVWSIFSPAFSSQTSQYSGALAGCLAGYVAGIAAFSRSSDAFGLWFGECL